MVTIALGTAAPEGSVTLPTITPRGDWEKAATATKRQAAKRGIRVIEISKAMVELVRPGWIEYTIPDNWLHTF
jgi:hypothetical protein